MSFSPAQAHQAFLWLYWIGVLAGFVMALLPGLGAQEPYLLLGVGVAVVLGLTALAYQLPADQRIPAGERIQTAGYLFTLVGFTAVLLMLPQLTGPQGSSEGVLQAAFGPLGTALATSILGWFLGGEVVATGEAPREHGPAPSTTVAAELERVAEAVSELHRAVQIMTEGIEGRGLVPAPPTPKQTTENIRSDQAGGEGSGADGAAEESV